MLDLMDITQVIQQRLPEAVVRGDRNASVKQLRLRLASVKSIQRITKVPRWHELKVRYSLNFIKVWSDFPPETEGIVNIQTMKMVAAAKLKGFQTRMYEV